MAKPDGARNFRQTVSSALAGRQVEAPSDQDDIGAR
jgi:hypothetical protein